MKKLKLLFSISTLCFALVVLCFGVLAAKSATYNVGGSISYEVKDAFVKVNTKVYSSNKLYNRGELELLSEDLADGNETLASKSFSLDTSFSIQEYDSSVADSFSFDELDLTFSPTNKSFVVEMDIANQSSSVNVWAIANWSIDENSNIVQGNNVIQREISSDTSKKMYFAISVEDFKISITGVDFVMSLSIGIGDYSLSEANLNKLEFTESGDYYSVTPSSSATGLVAIPESYNNKSVVIEPATYQEVSGQQVPVSPFATSNVTTLVLPKTVGNCQNMCVTSCQNIIRVVGAENYASDLMFYGGTGIYSARPKNLDGYTYALCSNLQAVDFGNCTSIGDYSFSACSNLRFVDFINIKTIGKFSFAGCGFAGEFVISGSVDTICQSAFEGIKITTLKLEEGIKTIENYAFEQCYSLTTITIPTSITNIGISFNSCTGLSIVNYNGTISQWNSITKDIDWNYNCPSNMLVKCIDGNI